MKLRPTSLEESASLAWQWIRQSNKTARCVTCAGPMTFLYQPLASGHVRLLTLLDDSGISCSLAEHALEEAPVFTCLSYSWREDGDDKTHPAQGSIVINGYSAIVHQNVLNALVHLGPTIRANGYKLWVDALCINQDDLYERAEQVKLMKRIYERAERVMGWTGPAPDDIELMLGFLGTLHTFSYDHLNRGEPRTAVDLWQLAISKRPFFLARPKQDVLKAWAGVVRMLKRSFWSRTWVQQEVTGRNAYFYCGKWHFTWKDLFAFSAFHGTYGGLRDMPEQYALLFSGGANVGSPFFDMLAARSSRNLVEESSGSEQRLMILIRELRLTTCSDARDKVFAALPHATDTGSLDASNPLMVDYSKSVLRVYTDVARFYLQQGNLEILGYVGTQRSDTVYRPPRSPDEAPLPSWVPDWRIPYRIRPLNAAGRIRRDYNMVYHPSPSSTSLIIHVSDSEFRIQGLVIDTLRSPVTNSGRQHITKQLKHTWGKRIRHWAPHLTDKDVIRILNADIQYSFNEEGRTRGEGVLPWEFLDRPIESFAEEKHRAWRVNMRHVMRSVCRDRRAGYTEAGRVGIFPEASVRGDKIAIFHGGHALYVIRPVSERPGVYNFVGECYVDQMMDGQAVQLAEQQGVPTELLTLV